MKVSELFERQRAASPIVDNVRSAMAELRKLGYKVRTDSRVKGRHEGSARALMKIEGPAIDGPDLAKLLKKHKVGFGPFGFSKDGEKHITIVRLVQDLREGFQVGDPVEVKASYGDGYGEPGRIDGPAVNGRFKVKLKDGTIRDVPLKALMKARKKTTNESTHESEAYKKGLAAGKREKYPTCPYGGTTSKEHKDWVRGVNASKKDLDEGIADLQKRADQFVSSLESKLKKFGFRKDRNLFVDPNGNVISVEIDHEDGEDGETWISWAVGKKRGSKVQYSESGNDPIGERHEVTDTLLRFANESFKD